MVSYLMELGDLTNVVVDELALNAATLRQLATWYRGNAVSGQVDTLAFWEKWKTVTSRTRRMG